MKKTKRVEAWTLRGEPRTGESVRLVELRPGEVVVTREEARVLKAALLDAEVWLDPEQPMAPRGDRAAALRSVRAALRATKARNTPPPKAPAIEPCSSPHREGRHEFYMQDRYSKICRACGVVVQVRARGATKARKA